ncbi:4-(cytidine 5'-diphospho)-2-C-methyl-D-erythritol kinase [Thalassoglobus polymorphus]|uniref:4-diphosphocytidyl-2-C-methyl-D-erythritol kinase n=1 Tax=Thalassoglobus polymorphus TaxID=2527994 RepID=A0A517QT16_9PLAN|nr:4-(cytidine 5'-diphospho)-2-C-methyl-D-erythritol kinase [Thalassoglobus polymorphus]QDT34781.1 4-diphosphocytidyl-2-C-methyl-D-erythritol kinase [Thalassoglobus polymorphus]
MRTRRDNSSLIVQVPAKINLSLRILGRRDDGFHDLETLMVSVRMYDSIRFDLQESPLVQLTSTSLLPNEKPLPNDDRNLIIQAAQLLQRTTETRSGAIIHLNKRIPSEAGMGGGSSDAAATLVALNQLWELNLSQEKLHQLAASLGSDLNFFLDSNVAAICTGRGEIVTPVRVKRPLHFVIVKPQSGLSTADVFKHWTAHSSPETPHHDEIVQALESGGLSQISWLVTNSLQGSARNLSREIEKSLELLDQHDIVVSGMTGSGSACFGLCRSRKSANRVARKIQSLGVMESWAVTSGV